MLTNINKSKNKSMAIYALSIQSKNEYELPLEWKNTSYHELCSTRFYKSPHNQHSSMLRNLANDPYLYITEIMSINNGTQVWAYAVDPAAYFTTRGHRVPIPKMYVNLFGTRLLCVFNNGFATLSHPIRRSSFRTRQYGLIIICDVPTNNLTHNILQSEQMTNVGLTLLDLQSMENVSSVISANFSDEYLLKYIGNMINGKYIPNVTLPVCSSSIINKNEIYKHEKIHSAVILNGKKRYKLGLCTVLNRKTVAHKLLFKMLFIDYVLEFIEYYSMVGVEQIYIYDIHWEQSNMTWEYLSPYYTNDRRIVTYIEWPFAYVHPPLHKFSALNSCMMRFAKDNEYIINVDLDEFIFRISNSSNGLSLVDSISHLNEKYAQGLEKKITFIQIGCLYSGLCNIDVEHGCNQIYRTFISRYLCVHDRGNGNNLESKLDRTKYIVDPDEVYNAFLHKPAMKNISIYLKMKRFPGISARVRHKKGVITVYEYFSCIHAHLKPFKYEFKKYESFTMKNIEQQLSHRVTNARIEINKYTKIDLNPRWPPLTNDKYRDCSFERRKHHLL